MWAIGGVKGLKELDKAKLINSSQHKLGQLSITLTVYLLIPWFWYSTPQILMSFATQLVSRIGVGQKRRRY